METTIYSDIAARTGGDIYIGVVGPVRTGKSTLIKRIMEELVIPNIDDPYRRDRARDELPQSGSGKTIMTAEPKFVPEEAVEISPDGKARLRVRMIDSVGYMIPGAVGATEEGEPRMVHTAWFPDPIPMTQAAELGTKKVMEEHCAIGIVVTTDGTITDIPREDYAEAEARAIQDMRSTGKPFLVVVNSTAPDGEAARQVCRGLTERFGVACAATDCQTLGQAEIGDLLTDLLYAFPVEQFQVHLPRWMNVLESEHPMKQSVYGGLLDLAQGFSTLRTAEGAGESLSHLPNVAAAQLRKVDPGTGCVSWELRFPEELYYEVLSQRTGLPIGDEGELMSLLTELAEAKRAYDKLKGALEEVTATGYGVVMPDRSEMRLEAPEVIRRGGAYGVKLKAGAPSIHMLRVDVDAEISPMVGDEAQSRALVDRLAQEYEGDPEKLWESNIFGRSVYEMVSDGLNAKLLRLPEDVRAKFRGSLSRIVNEGAGGLICLIL